MTRSEIDRNGGAEGMTDGAESRFHFFLGKSETFRQRLQRGIARRPHTGDGGVALAFSVAGRIHQQERIVRIWIAREDCRPVERKRTIATKCDPKSRG